MFTTEQRTALKLLRHAALSMTKRDVLCLLEEDTSPTEFLEKFTDMGNVQIDFNTLLKMLEMALVKAPDLLDVLHMYNLYGHTGYGYFKMEDLESSRSTIERIKRLVTYHTIGSLTSSLGAKPQLEKVQKAAAHTSDFYLRMGLESDVCTEKEAT